jgi:hypothetical protein
MNERHLEHSDHADRARPDIVATAIEELSEAIGDITTAQELRHTALELAIQCYLKPNGELTDIMALAEGFLRFLSAGDEIETPAA